jgi:uncharacterized membrane protein
MTKNDFLSQLEYRLRALPENERRDAVEYYEGYIDDAAGDEASVIERLGPPAEVAAKILAEYATAGSYESEPAKKQGLSMAWAVILAVFAVPIGLPIAIAVAAVAIALLVTVFSLLVAFGATAISLVVGGAAALVVGIVALFQNIPIALMAIGSALVLAGIGALFAKLAAVMATAGFRAVARFAGKAIIRRGK